MLRYATVPYRPQRLFVGILVLDYLELELPYRNDGRPGIGGLVGILELYKDDAPVLHDFLLVVHDPEVYVRTQVRRGVLHPKPQQILGLSEDGNLRFVE